METDSRDTRDPTSFDRAVAPSPITTTTPDSKPPRSSLLFHQRHNSYQDVPDSPSPLYSPSLASSLGLSGITSPLRRELSHTTLHDDDADPDAAAEADGDGDAEHTANAANNASHRDALARRLNLLAKQISSVHDDAAVDESALTSQLDQLEKAVVTPTPKYHLHQHRRQQLSSTLPQTPPSLQHRQTYHHPRRPMSLDMRTRSDGAASFASSLIRTRYSDFLIPREPTPDPADDEEDTPKKVMTAQQANKIVSETAKLNDELTTIVTNLKARQEESDHIQGLLIERAERAAQRILFLQNRVSYLEQELQENDDELQHLRISLKAVEIQMPPHPDAELERCIATFKDDYSALKRRRNHRISLGSVASFDSSFFGAPSPSPTR